MRIAQSCTNFKELLYTFFISVGLLLFFSGCKVKPSADANKEHHKEMITNSNNNSVDPEKNTGEKLNNDERNLTFSLLESFS